MNRYENELGPRAWLVVFILSIALAAGCGDDDDSQGGEPSAGSGASGSGGASADGGAPPEGDASADGEPAALDIRPVVFVHGGFGWATQFESQAQRFMSNGYPRNYLAAYEHNTGPGALDPSEQIDPLDEIIDAVLQETGEEQVDLIAHSRGGGVCFHYLESSAERAAKVAHYVAVDSETGRSLTTGMDRTPGNVEMLAVWGEGDQTREVVGATNSYFPHNSHVEMCTAADTFVEMYTFFNDEKPETDQIVEASGDEVEIGGRVNYFPENTGALGTLAIYEVDTDTGYRVNDTPVGEWTIDAGGKWGPQTVDKGASYEFAFEHATGEKHSIYREPFYADDYFVHLITSPPDGLLAPYLAETAESTFILVHRDREIWGDQGDGNDILTVDGTSVATEQAAAREGRLIGLFLMDWGPGAHPQLEDPSVIDYGTHELGQSDLSAPITELAGLPFMSGLDLFIPGASPPDRTVEVKLVPRGSDGAEQVVNVPNWASDEIRLMVTFRDFVRSE